MEQARIFFQGEGDAWLKRNKTKLLPENDPILQALSGLGALGPTLLEIGCANGWRLKEIEKRFHLETYGIEPSESAVKEAQKNGLKVTRGTANNLPWSKSYFDTIIFGFCLYLVDRENLFTVVTEADRVLTNGGLILIWDFRVDYPCKRLYKHKEGVWSYKQNYSKLFTGNPAYSVVSTTDHDVTSVTILRKNIERGWPDQCE